MLSPAIAQDSIKLNIPTAKKLIADFSTCKATNTINSKKLATLSEIIKIEQAKRDNLYLQNEKCEENFRIIKTQAEEWEANYTTCVNDSVNCGELPWYKFDFKSMSVSSIVTLVVMLLI